jgi:hypothetical protein
MTHQAESGWRQHPRTAQHAAPHYPSTPLRQHVRRALRLFAAAGTGAMGLCVVVGAIALVAATTTSPRHAPHLASELQREPARQRAGSGSGAPPGAGSRPAAASRPRPAGNSRPRPAGAGPARPAGDSQTRTAGNSRPWTLMWSYSCQVPGPPGSFVVREGGAHASGGVSVHETDTAGHGATWAFRDAGPHTLVVSSGCAWTLQVLRPPPPG